MLIRDVPRYRREQANVASREPAGASFEISAEAQPFEERFCPAVFRPVASICPVRFQSSISPGSVRIEQLNQRGSEHKIRTTVQAFPDSLFPLRAAHFRKASDDLVRSAMSIHSRGSNTCGSLRRLPTRFSDNGWS